MISHLFVMYTIIDQDKDLHAIFYDNMKKLNIQDCNNSFYLIFFC